jgi:hypothetical protein
MHHQYWQSDHDASTKYAMGAARQGLVPRCRGSGVHKVGSAVGTIGVPLIAPGQSFRASFLIATSAVALGLPLALFLPRECRWRYPSAPALQE